MKSFISRISKRISLILGIVLLLGMMGFSFNGLAFASDADVNSAEKGYEYWRSLGSRTAIEAMGMIWQKGAAPLKSNLIAMTNAGFAEIDGEGTLGMIDGLADVTGCRRGNRTLIEIHARYDDPLWCGVYDMKSGYCAYLEIQRADLPDAVDTVPITALCSVTVVEKIDAAHLYANVEVYDEKFKNKLFGSNSFRIVTIANAVAQGAPAAAIKAFEYHDHYCPGVTSGILMVNYVKKHFPQTPGGKYFIQSLQPWCKEDALMTLMNATPGKKGYDVLYTTEADRKKWKEAVRETATLVYREDRETKRWEVLLLGFQWEGTDCDRFGKKSLITKLCMDLWYLEKLNTPEICIKALGRFSLPEGVTPLDWARPGMDPMVQLGLSVK